MNYNMPELPEVEIVKQELENLIVGKTVKNVIVLHENIIEKPLVKEFKESLIGETFKSVTRRGKWLILELDHYNLLSHLRMEGKYFLKKKEASLEKHNHIVFEFDNDKLIYDDVRKFGKMYLYKKTDNIFNEKPLNSLGYEPFEEIDEILLKEKFNKNKPIKNLLLDQTIIAGIGNIYASEILFDSMISPFKMGKDLSLEEVRKIVFSSRKILESAIKKGGTTIKSFSHNDGISGMFQQDLKVYQQENCPVCESKIIKIKQQSRMTYYCPSCQIETNEDLC